MNQRLFLQPEVRQDQRLIMNEAMEQAFQVLQMPILELVEWLEREIEHNPLLEISPCSCSSSDLSQISVQPSLYEYLIGEIPYHFETDEEKEIAKTIAGSLDENGFLTEMIPGADQVLTRFQQIEPLGLGARNVQESLLIQLSNKQDQIIYQIISDDYDDLLHHRLMKIAKKYKLSMEDLKLLIKKELKHLHPYPGRLFEQKPNPPLIPDLSIQKEGEVWSVEINDSDLPSFHIQPVYLDALESNQIKAAEMDYFRRHLATGKWLLKILDRRKKTLQEIGVYLLKKQKSYFEGEIPAPLPMTMKEVAKALHMSESTITRAISNKAIVSPRGLTQLRSFFTHPIASKQGAVSNKQVKDLLMTLIEQEKEPLSDQALAEELQKQGISCARRTVSKYRKEFKIGTASQRKTWK